MLGYAGMQNLQKHDPAEAPNQSFHHHHLSKPYSPNKPH